VTTRTTCICGKHLQLQPFSTHFDTLVCTACRTQHFAPAKGAPVREFQYTDTNDKYSERSYLFGQQFRWSHEQLLSQEWQGRRVLEIGCFNGFFIAALARKGADVHGFDVNADAVRVGREQFGLDGRIFDNMHDASECGPFDDVICIDVVEHLDQPESFVAEMRQLLKPGGRIIVAGPVVERRFHDKSDYPPHHKWWFSRKGLRDLLNQSGYHVQETHTQHDGLLMLRNALGKWASGKRDREFYGDVQVAAPDLSGPIRAKLYSAASAIGRGVFRSLGIVYCSAIIEAVVATKP
jgi:SAM-dependent methyltransferase